MILGPARKIRVGNKLYFGDADELVAEVIDNIAQKLLKPSEGWTNIFIHPPYNFNAADSLFTNFHLPKTSLLLMMDAFAG